MRLYPEQIKRYVEEDLRPATSLDSEQAQELATLIEALVAEIERAEKHLIRERLAMHAERQRVEVAASALRQIAAKQPEMLETYRENGIVFKDIGREPGNWQHVAFSTYTQLCETETLARTALADLGVLPDAPSKPRPSSTG